MGQAFLVRRGGDGSGGSLNFSVVGGTAQPENPKENTIWVNTSIAIESYVISLSVPQSPTEGMVWIRMGDAPVISVNVLEENALLLELIECLQYIDDEWVKREASVYQNGWAELRKYLFKRGYDYSEITGGINGTVQDDAFYVSATIQKSENKTYTTNKAVDLTNINTIFAKVYSPNTTADVYNRITVTAGAYNGSNVQTSNLKSYTQTTAPFTSPEQIVSLDVSTLKGAFYLGYTWGVLSSGSSKAVTGYVYEWWVE